MTSFKVPCNHLVVLLVEFIEIIITYVATACNNFKHDFLCIESNYWSGFKVSLEAF